MPKTRGILSGASTLLIVILLFAPGSAVPQVGFSGVDLVAHLALFACWGAAVTWEFRNLSLLKMGLAAVCFALVTELVQTTIAGRAFSWSDIAMDIIGVGLGSALVRWARQTRQRDDRTHNSQRNQPQ